MPAIVDILDPATFEKTGVQKPIREAWAAGDWTGSFNLWIVRDGEHGPSILYQLRTRKKGWAPGLLDVAAGGHYEAGEEMRDGLREVREELSREYAFEDLTYLGRKFYRRDECDIHYRSAVDVFIVRDDASLDVYRLQREELDGFFECPIDELVRVHRDEAYSFIASGVEFRDNELVPAEMTVRRDSFPINEDDYHAKMARIAQRFFEGEKGLHYQ